MAAKKKKNDSPGEFLVCRNPQALRRYEIVEKLEAGMVLSGSEVKSLRARQANLEGAYAGTVGSEIFLHKMHIAPYEQATQFQHEPTASRKLLLHRREIEKWIGKLATRGLTLVPIRVYFKNGRAKVELGLGKARNKGDKRESIRRDQDKREARAAMMRK